MNCLEFRRMTLSDPGSHDSGYLRHRHECAACRDYAADSADFEAGLREAMTIGVPDDLVARVLLVQAIADEQAPRWRFGAWSGWFSGLVPGMVPGVALAASLIMLVTVAWLGMRGFGGVPLSLSTELVAHIEAERSHLTQTGEVGERRLAMLLEGVGARVRHSPGRVSYAGSCEIRNKKGVHLVLQGERGPVTVLYLPAERPGSLKHFEQDGFYGELIAAGEGSLAVVGEDAEALEPIIANLDQAIAWGP